MNKTEHEIKDTEVGDNMIKFIDVRKGSKEEGEPSIIIESGRRKLNYGDLFEYLEVNLESCSGDLEITEEFCKIYSIDINAVKQRLENTGGFCDCEVLLNSRSRINKDETLN